MPDEPCTAVQIRRIGADGQIVDIGRSIATELPVALEFNGLGYAVLMASPNDLVDLAYGFARSERLIDSPGEIVDVDTHPMDEGMIVRVTLVTARIGTRRRASSPSRIGIFLRPVRHRKSRAGAAAHTAGHATILGLRA